MLVLRRFAPAIPGSLVAVIFGGSLVKLFDLDDKGVAIVGHIDSGLPTFGLPDAIGINDYFATAARVGRHHARGIRRRARRGEDVRDANHYEIDPTVS